MAGGGGKPQNIFTFKAGAEEKKMLNWRLWFAVISFGIMGAARGVDEGLISGTLNSTNFLNNIGYNKMNKTDQANTKANISAMVQIGSVLGAAIAFVLADRIGRLWATRQLCALWIIGIVIFMTNGGRLGQVYAGRFIAGLGIGQTTVIAPVYIAEVAPKFVRGLCTCIFAGSVYLGIMLAYFATWGTSLHIPLTSPQSYLIPTSLHLMFAGIIFVLSFFNYESPRFLIKIGNVPKAVENLARVRGVPAEHKAVQSEIAEIQTALELEQEATHGAGFMGLLKEMFTDRNNLFRIYVGLGSQLWSQWSGANSITIYAPDMFALLGTTGDNEKLFATAIFGVVKFLAAVMCALFLVDIIGRKRSLGIGIAFQTISMGYIAAFLTAVPNVAGATGSAKAASTGAIVMIYLSGFGWALGWNSLQYLLNAEIYPLRIRAVSSSLVMCFHFVNQYGNSRAVPIMLLTPGLGGLGPSGTFWFFTGITILGGAWAWLTIPETAGRSLESMDALFALPWYKIGRYGAQEAEKFDRLQQEKEARHGGQVIVTDEKGRNSSSDGQVEEVSHVHINKA